MIADNPTYPFGRLCASCCPRRSGPEPCSREAWELVVVLGLGKDPCNLYLELPTTLGLVPITPIKLVVNKAENLCSKGWDGGNLNFLQ